MVFGNSSSKKKKRRKTITKNKDAVGGEDNDIGNDLRLDNHSKWLELCRLKESNIKACGSIWKGETNNYYGYNSHQIIIECPNHSDILSGRGKGVSNHPGNQLLASIVLSKLDEYVVLTSYTETIKLTKEVVHLLKNEYGARFLSQETTETNGNLGCWVEISDEEARRKVRLAFRDKIKSRKQSGEQQISQELLEQPKTTMLISTAMEPPPMMMATFDNNDYNNNNNNDPNNDNNNAGIAIASNGAIKKTFTTSIHQKGEQLTENPLHVSHYEYGLQEEARPDTNTSILSSMTGDSGCGDCGGGNSNSNTVTSTTGKKRQLQTTTCFNFFDTTSKK